MPQSGSLSQFIGLGERLRQLRRRRSQKEFAQCLGIPLRSYQRYERGDSNPPMERVKKIAEICGVTVNYLLTGNEAPVQYEEHILDFSHKSPQMTLHYIRPKKNMIKADRWVSVDELAFYLDINRDTVYELMESKDMPGCKIGRFWKFKLKDIDEWVRSGRASD